MSFTFGSSSADSSLFPPAAAAKLKVDRMLATGLITARGEGGRELSLRVSGDRGAPLRSTPWRELVRDMECWPTRSFVTSRSLSRRSAMTFSLAVTSTGLEPNRPCQRTKFEWEEKDTNLAAPKGLGRFAGLLWAILGEASGDGVEEVVPERGRSSNFRRASWGVGGVDDVATRSCKQSFHMGRIIDSRDVLLRDEKPARGPLLQSLSAGESGDTLDGGPMSPRPLAPNLRPAPSSSLGLNLPPIVQVSSLSAAPPLSDPTKPEFLRLIGVSDSGGGARVGRLERQSPEVSETGVAVDCRSLGGPS